MTAAYKQKITQAFRDNSIKSVLLIDDEYQSYEALVENTETFNKKLVELENSGITDINEYKKALSDILNTDKVIIGNKTENFLRRSSKAQQFTNFFHSKKKICSVESNVEQLEVEKIRKSDLVVLDYHLNPENKGGEALSSLKLISDLSNNKHMNIVVVYTNEELETVWQQIAAVLYGDRSDSIKLQEDELDAWDRNQPDWEEEWRNSVFDKSMLRKHLFGELDYQALLSDLKELVDEDTSDDLSIPHVKKLLEGSILKLNLIKAKETSLAIHGTEGKWIQAGHVFIALKSKQDHNDDPKDIWDCIEECLHDWKPSFYRLITSELQNQIEDANLSMEKSLSCTEKEQMAFLWGILQTTEKDKIRITRELLGNIANEALDKILYNSDFITQVVNTTEEMSHPKIQHVIRNPKDDAPYKEFQRKILKLASTNVTKESDISDDRQYEIAHAYNEKLSTTTHFPTYITTGSIIRDENDTWYICVTPSCNTVPQQETDRSIRDLKPHRALTLARLKKISPVDEALHNAHHSSYIYITSPESEALAFSVIDTTSKLPDLIKVIVMNHDNEMWEGDGHKIITTFKTTKSGIKQNTKKIYPIALLKPAYAARYQNIQSHYEGRIGVDFITLDLSEPEPPTSNNCTLALADTEQSSVSHENTKEDN